MIAIDWFLLIISSLIGVEIGAIMAWIFVNGKQGELKDG